MVKRLAIYTAEKAENRLAFGAAIRGIDENCVDAIDDHAFTFESDKTLDELFEILAATGIERPPDEFFILTLEKPFTGIGSAKNELTKFFIK